MKIQWKYKEIVTWNFFIMCPGTNTLFVHQLVFLVTHPFLHGFQFFSYLCSTCKSESNHLNVFKKSFYTFLITWNHNKISGINLWIFSKSLKKMWPGTFSKLVKVFPCPQDVTELKRFLGISSYYQRFIHGYAIHFTHWLRKIKLHECQQHLRSWKRD